MKKRVYAGLIVVACVTVGVVFLVAPRPNQRSTPEETELKALRAQVEKLEQTTAKLQRELGDMRGRPQVQVLAPENPIMVPSGMPPKSGSQVPPGWKPFEFNGMTYYLTPLKHESGIN